MAHSENAPFVYYTPVIVLFLENARNIPCVLEVVQPYYSTTHQPEIESPDLVLLSHSTNKETNPNGDAACSSPNPDLLTQLSSPSVRLSRTARPHAAHGHGPHAQPHSTAPDRFAAASLTPSAAAPVTELHEHRACLLHARCCPALSRSRLAVLTPPARPFALALSRLAATRSTATRVTVARPHGSRTARPAALLHG
ncbi:hypothetical protein Scep_024635 [Stephania cephalantha]|uniref:Uncharacterized protein n=1 Tax=Stephania cephalantha TaxID=152367 RepID=A0AAP0HYM6_9MAGN